jgi:hypothetical protein
VAASVTVAHILLNALNIEKKNKKKLGNGQKITTTTSIIIIIIKMYVTGKRIQEFDEAIPSSSSSAHDH